MELIKNGDARAEKLAAYLELLGKGEASRDNYDRFGDVLRTATSHEVNTALHDVLSLAADLNEWKVPVSRFVRAVAHGLDSESVPPYPEGHLLFRLERENHEILATLGELQAQSILAQKSAGSPGSIRETLKKFTALKTHYVALQNELFPLFESASAKNACARLMWAIEDDVLLVQRELCESPLAEDAHYFWKDFGKFFLMAGALAYRERKILFPAAFRSIPSEYFFTQGSSQRNLVHHKNGNAFAR